MGQIKIFGNKDFIKQNKETISNEIHKAVVAALKYPENKKFHRFLGLEKDDFIYPNDRSEKYLIIEISLFDGRSDEAKRTLIKEIYKNLKKALGIEEIDIEITIFETPKINWGIRGLCGDQLELNYKVEV